jgi:hypothetical protein
MNNMGENMKKGMEHIDALVDIFGHNFKYRLENYIACYDYMMENYCPFKIGDRVELTTTPEITAEKSWGWMGSKHFLIKGAKGTVKEREFFKDHFGFGIIFDDESFVDSFTKQIHMIENKHFYNFSEKWLRKINENEEKQADLSLCSCMGEGC